MEYLMRKLIQDLRVEGEEHKEALLRTMRRVLDEKPKQDSPDKTELKERKRKEVRRRIKDRSFATPLSRLAQIEAHLSEHSAALAKLSESDATFAEPDRVAGGTPHSNNFAGLAKAPDFREKRPDKDLLVHQLTRLIPRRAVASQHQAQRLQSDVIALFASMGSKNSLESILDRLIVGVEVAAFDCLDRAAQPTDQRARDVNLRHGMKGAAIIINLMRFRDERRGQVSQSVTVGRLKIQSGQPLIGSVQNGPIADTTGPVRISRRGANDDDHASS
jgi:hypothetical protein